jgi:hypothetical protein
MQRSRSPYTSLPILPITYCLLSIVYCLLSIVMRTRHITDTTDRYIRPTSICSSAPNAMPIIFHERTKISAFFSRFQSCRSPDWTNSRAAIPSRFRERRLTRPYVSLRKQWLSPEQRLHFLRITLIKACCKLGPKFIFRPLFARGGVLIASIALVKLDTELRKLQTHP